MHDTADGQLFVRTLVVERVRESEVRRTVVSRVEEDIPAWKERRQREDNDDPTRKLRCSQALAGPLMRHPIMLNTRDIVSMLLFIFVFSCWSICVGQRKQPVSLLFPHTPPVV